MKKACIGLGSNLGDSLSILQNAWKLLCEHPDIIPVSLSSPYRTEPVGMKSCNWFLNAAGCVETTLQPNELLSFLLEHEKHFGRTRNLVTKGYQDRTLDLDILLFDDIILNSPNLVIPHPYLHKRLFAVGPLAEIEPQFIHPVLKRTMSELLADLFARQDKIAFEKFEWSTFCYSL